MAFRRNFWVCILVAVILTVISSGSGSSNGRNRQQQTRIESSQQLNGQQIANTIQNATGTLRVNVGPLGWIISTIGWGLGIVITLAIGSLAFLLSALIFNPLKVGCRRFFLVNLYGKANFGEVGFAFKNNLLNVAWTMFVTDVKIFLWCLLLVIPGIIKSYEYRMIPYILAENPNIATRDAFQASKRMMDGNKMNAFMLDLSFIGWFILNALTAGLVGLFWLNPYKASTDAALYDTLR